MRSIQSTAVVLTLTAVMAAQAAAPARTAKRHQDWLKGPVSYLLTKAERDAFLNLQTESECDRFIDRFWETRNPAPGSGQNEFKDEFYRRVAYADAHYGLYSGSEGWRTDMGKTYILFGRPQTSSNYVANQELHPIELWFYSNPGLAELPPFFYVMFYEKDDVSGYRLYHPYVDGPDKLLRSGGTAAQAYRYLRDINVELARASLTLIPGEPVDTQYYSGSMESASILNAIQGYREMPSYVALVEARAARIERVTTRIAFDMPRAVMTTLVVREQGEPWLYWQVEVDDPMQPKAAAGRVEYEVAARLYARSQLVFERTDRPQFAVPVGTEDALKQRPFLYEDRMPAVPGEYRLTVTVRSRATGKTYEATKNISIPAAGDRTILSEIVVASRNEAESRPRPFRFAGVKFFPAAQGHVRAPAGLHILYQVTAGEPRPVAYDVEYIVGSVTTKFRKIFEDKLDLGRLDAGSLLTAKTLPIEDLSPGSYQLVVRIKDPQTNTVSAQSAGFTVIGAQDDPAPIVVSRGGTDTPQWTAISQYERALCWLAQDRPADAVANLESSWKLNANPVTKGLLEHLYQQAGKKSDRLN